MARAWRRNGCSRPGHASVDQKNNGSRIVEAAYSTGDYAKPIEVEDFLNRNATIAMAAMPTMIPPTVP
jgi:hypothetical protein